MSDKKTTINDVLNELKRLQIEHGDVEIFSWTAKADSEDWHSASAWPVYNEKENRVEF